MDEVTVYVIKERHDGGQFDIGEAPYTLLADAEERLEVLAEENPGIDYVVAMYAAEIVGMTYLGPA